MSDHDPSWYSPPNVRGTKDLVYSCLATLALCAWTAYHPNINPGKGFIGARVRRLAWLILVVFAPELVLFCAFDQYYMARTLQKQLKQVGKGEFDNTGEEPCEICQGGIGDDQVDLENLGPIAPMLSAGTSTDETLKWNTKASYDWTLQQALFAVSGGFAVDSKSFFFEPTLTFTPAGIVELAKLGLLPHASTETVEDKSKADTATKMFVLCQASWFLVQCVARRIQGLPLTLLEIHTLIHIGCAFIMYGLWFQKPYDVQHPIVCEDERIINMAAFFACKAHKDRTWSDRTLRCCQTVNFGPKHVRGSRPESYMPGLHLFRSDKHEHYTPFEKRHTINTHLAREHFEKAQLGYARLQRSGQHFLWTEHALGGYTRQTSTDFSKDGMDFDTDYVVPARSNLRIEGSLAGFEDRMNTIGYLGEKRILPFVVLSAAYGAAHFSAWNSHFPSYVEMWMWRTSCILMAGVPIYAVVLTLFEIFAVDTLESIQAQQGIRAKLLRPCHYLYAGAAFFMMYLMYGYVLGRLYVLVESFASLRSPPVGTYKTVDWTKWWPHVG